MRIASIDIGSNTILMQILNENSSLSNSYQIIAEKHGIARLSEGLNKTGIINETAILRAEAILREYNAVCIENNVDKIIAVGTSALREAQNSSEVVARLDNCLANCSIEIIDGTTEAEYSFIGAIIDKVKSGDDKIKSKNYVVIDVGGGSTEIISGNIDRINYKISVPIGVVKLTERYLMTQPLNNDINKTNNDINKINNLTKIKDYVRDAFSIVDFSKCIGEVIAVSGTPTAMAGIALGINEYDSAKINNYVFSKAKLNDISALIYSATIDDLVNKYSIERGRADVLSAGAIILCTIVDMLGKDDLIVSVNGLRYGVAVSYFKRNK